MRKHFFAFCAVITLLLSQNVFASAIDSINIEGTYKGHGTYNINTILDYIDINLHSPIPHRCKLIISKVGSDQDGIIIKNATYRFDLSFAKEKRVFYTSMTPSSGTHGICVSATENISSEETFGVNSLDIYFREDGSIDNIVEGVFRDIRFTCEDFEKVAE